jgi:hypothetical protein
MRVAVQGRNLEEALTNALNSVVSSTSAADSTNDGCLAIPLLARESQPAALVAAMLSSLIEEMNDGATVSSVQVDGLLKRDGALVCWGYAFATSEEMKGARSTILFRDLRVEESPANVEIEFTLEVGSSNEDEVHRGGVAPKS